MPSNSIKDLNRTCLATKIPAEANTYAVIELDNRRETIAIDSITWGSQIINSTDRTNFIGHYAALIRNMSVSDDTSFSSNAPVGLPAGAEILWMDFQNALGGETHKTFSKPFLLPPGDKYILVVPAPAMAAALNATIYYHVSLNGRIITDAQTGGWRLY